MEAVEGREGSIKSPVASWMVVVVVVMVVMMVVLVPPVHPIFYYKTFLDSTAIYASCPPTKVYSLNNIKLRLPLSHCAQECETLSGCHAFRVVDETCHTHLLYLTSGYSMTEEEPNALPVYHKLSMKHYYPNTDLAYRATVTAGSNLWPSPTYERDLTGGVLCTRTKCPCTNGKNHSVVVDLGSSVLVREVRAITFHPPQNYSQNFIGYLGDKDNMYAHKYTFGELPSYATTFVIRTTKTIQYITFFKPDNLLCLCLVQVF